MSDLMGEVVALISSFLSFPQGLSLRCINKSWKRGMDTWGASIIHELFLYTASNAEHFTHATVRTDGWALDSWLQPPEGLRGMSNYLKYIQMTQSEGELLRVFFDKGAAAFSSTTLATHILKPEILRENVDTQFVKLKALSLADCIAIQEDSFCELIRLCPNLEYCNIHGCVDHIGKEGFQQLTQECKHLAHLNISCSENFISLLVQGVFQLPSGLLSLYADAMLQSGHSKLRVKFLPKIKAQCPMLQLLSFSSNGFASESDSVVPLSDIFPKTLISFICFDASYDCFTDWGKFLQMLEVSDSSQLPRLKEVHLTPTAKDAFIILCEKFFNHVEDLGIQPTTTNEIITPILFPAVTKLRLVGCTDGSWAREAGYAKSIALRFADKLQYLDISKIRLDLHQPKYRAEDCASLVSIIDNCTNLTELNLSKLGKEVNWSDMLASLRKHPKLLRVGLYDNPSLTQLWVDDVKANGSPKWQLLPKRNASW